MDETDFAIVRALMDAPLRGAASMAREMGVSPQTVRNRIARIQAGSDGFKAIPSGIVLDRTGYAVSIPSGSLEDIMEHPDAYWGVEYDDGTVAGLFFARQPPEFDMVWQQRARPRAPVPRQVSRSEWALIPHLMDNALLSVDELATRTGLASKTVRKYRARLFDDGLLDLVLSINEADVANALWHHVFVLGETPRRVHGIPLAWTDPPGAVMVLHADSPRQRAEQCAQIADENPHAMVASRIGMRHQFSTGRMMSWLDGAAAAALPITGAAPHSAP